MAITTLLDAKLCCIKLDVLICWHHVFVLCRDLNIHGMCTLIFNVISYMKNVLGMAITTIFLIIVIFYPF